jgi:hypothetical protein
MPCQNCLLGCCQYVVPFNEPHEQPANILNHGSHRPIAPRRQGPDRPSFHQTNVNPSFNVANATNAWFQSAHAGPEYRNTSFNTMQYTANPTPVQVAEYRANHHQPRDNGYNIAPYTRPTAFVTSSTTQEQASRPSCAIARARPTSHQNPAPPHVETFRCDWEGCSYTGTFNRRADLNRHTETQHIFPNAYKCPFPQCGSVHNREDNLQAHLRNVHGLSQSLR